MRKISVILSFILISVLSLAACTGAGEDNENKNLKEEKILVSTTINPVDEIVNIIGKDKVETNRMVPKGSDAHDFEPTIKDMETLKNSKILFINGLEMESWVEKAVEVSGNKKLEIIDLSKGVDLINLSEYDNGEDDDHSEEEEDDDHGHEHGKYDPHIWLSLNSLEVMSENVYKELSSISPEDENFFKENLETFKKDILEVKDEYYKKFEPHKGKAFITGHAAFGYLTREMGLVQKSIEGPFQEGEPTPKKLRDLIEYVKENNITTIFLEQKASPRVSETLAREVNGKTVEINSLEDEGDILDNLKIIYDKILESFN